MRTIEAIDSLSAQLEDRPILPTDGDYDAAAASFVVRSTAIQA